MPDLAFSESYTPTTGVEASFDHTHLNLEHKHSADSIPVPHPYSSPERPSYSSPSSSGDMLFSSSPIKYPLSSSPPVDAPPKQKRKLFASLSKEIRHVKRPRVQGGFAVEEDDSASDSDDPKQSLHSNNAGLLVENTLEEPVRASPAHEPEAPLHTTVTASLPTTAVGASIYASSRLTPNFVNVETCSGKRSRISFRCRAQATTYEKLIAQRSVIAEGRAKKAYYGIDIHKLIDDAKIQKELDDAAKEVEEQRQTLEGIHTETIVSAAVMKGNTTHQMWTEKYRAKKFTELVGDERTHRSVLRWLKAWDMLVFPGNAKAKRSAHHEKDHEEKQHRKILLLTGPPGLGKTTLAHVCAKQAGYEVLEINASDDRSRDVVKGRIKDALGTETVRGIQEHGKVRKSGRPVCVVVDEVDGVVTGSGGGGDGGFMKALIDLVQLDQKNSSGQSQQKSSKKGDKFRLMRPLILICNDVYAPSLRPLRQSSLAEIVHVRKPPIDKVITRLKTVFERESIACDGDAVRRLCESSWGLTSRKQNGMSNHGAGEGDIRGVLVQGEWMAHKLRASSEAETRLTRKWVEAQIGDSATSQKGFGRGGLREVVDRIFVEGAGLPNLPTALSAEEARLVAESSSTPIGVADLRKRAAITALNGMINACDEHDRLMTECHATYPTQTFQDDTLLSKPNAGYEWLHFHDSLTQRIHSGQEWELGGYLTTSACGFHDLFASVDRGSRNYDIDKAQNEEADLDVHPFSGTKADFVAHEAQKQNRAVLTEMQSKFSAPLLRLFSSTDAIATELVPNVARMLAPEVKPNVVGGSGGNASVASVRKESERNCIKNAVRVMYGLSIDFEKVRIETEGFGAHSNGGYALRMEPPLDTLTTFFMPKGGSTSRLDCQPNLTNSESTTTTTITSAPAPVRYAIRQVLAQELAKEKILQASLSRQARGSTANPSSVPHHDIEADGNAAYNNPGEDKENAKPQSTISKLKAGTYDIKPTATSTNTSKSTNPTVKRDFFGRPIKVNSLTNPNTRTPSLQHSRSITSASPHIKSSASNGAQGSSRRIWVSFHEGYSNAVRKHISLKELMDGF